MTVGSRTRVCHLVSDDGWGGAEAVVAGLLRAQAARADLELTLIALNPGRLSALAAELGIPAEVAPEAGRGFLPLLRDALEGFNHYWVVDQAEYATDLIFTSRADLASLYPHLLDYAVLHFAAKDILTFLGRRLHPRFDGEVLSDCRKDRLPGARIKHRVGANWLKMYDKLGLVLRR